MSTIRRNMLTKGLLIAGVGAGGCCIFQEHPQAVVAEPSPAAMADCRMAFPTGDPGTSVLLLEKTCPKEVTVNQPFECSIEVTNLTALSVDNVVVEDHLPNGLKLVKSAPQAETSGGVTRWSLATIPAKQSKTITLTCAATSEGTLGSCASVSYSSALCCAINATQPSLALTMTAVPDALVCDPIPVRLVVTNNGSGVARNVRVTEQLPAGLTASDARSALAFEVPSLGPGESKEFIASLKAAKTGRYETRASATAEGGLKADSSAVVTTLRQPVLTIEMTGPERIFLGRTATFNIAASNTGDAVAANTVIENPLPAGTTFVSASDGGRLTGDTVVWSLGDLPPKASKKVSVTVNGSSVGSVTDRASARATCAAPVSDTVSAHYEGIPALLLEVVDANDPVQIGDSVTYEIRVTNQGSAVGTNIKIGAELESSMEFASAGGATNATKTGADIVFAPLPSLAPKAVATWRVTVKAVKEGDVRFAAKMTSDQLERSVDETESTNFYK